MKWDKNVHQSLVMITQFGFHMLVPIFLCTFLGIFLDRCLDTSWITILLFFIGAVAGFRNVYIFSRKIYSIESDRTSYTGRHRKDKHIHYDSQSDGKDK